MLTAAPSRPYSALIVGGLWPASDPQSWSRSGSALRHKGQELLAAADGIRHSADGVVAEGQSGHTINGFVDACHRNAHTVTAHADEYFAMADSADEIARLLDGLAKTSMTSTARPTTRYSASCAPVAVH